MVYRAELYAVLFALQHADPGGQGVLLLVDNEAVVRGLRRFRSSPAASKPSEAVDIWRRIAQLAAPSLDKWDVLWVLSHSNDLEPAKAVRRQRRARQQSRWAE